MNLYSSKPLKNSSKQIIPSTHQLILLSGLSWRSGILVVILNRIIIAHAWFFCCIFGGLKLDFFQTTKGLRFDSKPTSVPIFSFLPCAVYPVGVTTYWCNFLWIIVNKFASVYHILTKRNFHAFTKRRKNKETKPIFERSYLRNAWHNLVQFWNVGYWHLHSKNHLVSYKQHKLMCTWKLHYCSSFQYTHGCGALASLAARHTTVCFDLQRILKIRSYKNNDMMMIHL